MIPVLERTVMTNSDLVRRNNVGFYRRADDGHPSDLTAAALGGRAHLLLAWTKPASFENIAETLASFVTLASVQLALRRLATGDSNKIDFCNAR